jgi:two-component system sensor histidine kinase PilS (NtrC family)
VKPARDPTRLHGADSRLGALGLGEDTRLDMLADALSGFEATGYGRSAEGDEMAAGLRGVSRGTAADAGARRRVFRTYVAARVALAVALLGVQAVAIWAAARPMGVMLWLCLAYGLEAVLAWGWAWRTQREFERAGVTRLLWWITVGADLIAFGTMHWVDVVGSLNHAALLVLPVLMAGVLNSRLNGLATAAAVTLLLLGTAWQRALLTTDFAGQLSQAGLAGIGLFVIVVVTGEMAARLARQERSARNNLALALQQAELNRLVIDEMSDGVLVVDAGGGVRAANPAARSLLAESDRCPSAPFSLREQPGWKPLQAAIDAAYKTGRWPLEGQDLSVSFGSEVPRSIRLRARFTRRARVADAQAGRSEMLAVLFIEELRNVLARQRQERLVAMGRISAGVAHEIRNPLAAISQANALLQEDALRPDQQRLVRIVADNVERLKRIVDDVMEAAPGGATPSRTLDACAEVAAICSEWARTVGLTLGAESRLRVNLPSEAVGVAFDPDHLRRVLINLLENGLRHASAQPGAVQLRLEALDAPLVRLTVASDGEPIATEVEAHLFEPFHSTRSRGTGLGLYICRELCMRHGASIDYLRRPGEPHANVFQVVMRRETIASPDRLHL